MSKDVFEHDNIIGEEVKECWTYKYFRIKKVIDGGIDCRDAFEVVHLPTKRRMHYSTKRYFDDLQKAKDFVLFLDSKDTFAWSKGNMWYFIGKEEEYCSVLDEFKNKG
jgi:hypothetical protein